MSCGVQAGPPERKPEAELATGQEPGCPAQGPPRAWPAVVHTGSPQDPENQLRTAAASGLCPLTPSHQGPLCVRGAPSLSLPGPQQPHSGSLRTRSSRVHAEAPPPPAWLPAPGSAAVTTPRRAGVIVEKTSLLSPFSSLSR